MTRLSVNINKVALIRNSRRDNYPNLIKIAQDCEKYGAQGITVHPRPDQRHIRYSDIPELKKEIKTEFNIEGYPSDDFVALCLKNKPDQVTLVPDLPGVLTSDSGWNTIVNEKFLLKIISNLQKAGIRVSLFIDAEEKYIEGAYKTGADRIEFYTGKYAKHYIENKEKAIEPFKKCAIIANDLGMGINAGHDLNLDNLEYFKTEIKGLLEVSIGHAIICDALYFGFHNTIQMYLNCLK